MNKYNNSIDNNTNNKIIPYIHRIKQTADDKNSRVILAIDFLPGNNIHEKIKDIVQKLYFGICAVKINFHLLIPFSLCEMKGINDYIHSFGIQTIADIKLNDIFDTNRIVIDYLSKMDFDAVIVNPFIGVTEMKKLVDYTHSKNMGVISLVHMSPLTANEGFGLSVIKESAGQQRKEMKMYELLLEYSINSNVDGIVLGATHQDIIERVSSASNIPIYSPGFFVQGGKIQNSDLNRMDYYIIGRYLINSRDPVLTLNEILSKIN